MGIWKGTENGYWPGGLDKREFTGVAEFSAPPAEAALLELNITLSDTVGNGLGRSSTPIASFPPGAGKTSSEELPCITLVGRGLSFHRTRRIHQGNSRGRLCSLFNLFGSRWRRRR